MLTLWQCLLASCWYAVYRKVFQRHSAGMQYIPFPPPIGELVPALHPEQMGNGGLLSVEFRSDFAGVALTVMG